jgi:hypothetical protein
MYLPLSMYAPTAAGLGGLAGGAVGALGNLLSPLDYPRQAALNAVRQPLRYLSGQGSASDLAGALPGLAGAAVAAPLIATGVGAPLGIGIGSLVAGAGQGLGKATGSEAFEAPTPGDLAEMAGIHKENNPWGHALGSMAIGMATDPLSYVGGLGGAAGGEALKASALARGPQYGGALEKLLGGQAVDKNTMRLITGWLKQGAGEQEALSRVLQELPEGSRPFAAGGNAIAYRPNTGGVTRISRLASEEGTGEIGGILKTPEVLQPTRTVSSGPYQVTHAPEVQSLSNVRNRMGLKIGELGPEIDPAAGLHPGQSRANLAQYMDEIEPRYNEASYKLASGAYKKGLDPFDLMPQTGNALENIARTPEGAWLTHDPGAIRQGTSNIGRTMPTELQDPGGVTNALLNALGAHDAVRAAINRGMRSTRGQGVRIPGF